MNKFGTGKYAESETHRQSKSDLGPGFNPYYGF